MVIKHLLLNYNFLLIYQLKTTNLSIKDINYFINIS